MAVEEVVMHYERCDRCSAVIRVFDDNNKVVEVRTTSAGPVNVTIGKKTLVKYEKICPICVRRITKLAREMGPVDRTKGGMRKGKKK